MINRSILIEIFVFIGLVGTSVVLLSTDYLMSNEMHVLLLFAMAIGFIAFSMFFYKERVEDERGVLHRFIASRFSLFMGTAVIVVGIIYQHFTSVIDPWLLIALIAFLGSKILARIYCEFEK